MAANTNDFRFSSEHSDENLLDEEAISRLQAYIRAFLIRKKFQDVRKLYEDIISEVESDVVANSPSSVHWQTHLPCKPRYFQKPRRSSVVVKDGTQKTQSQHSRPKQQAVQDTSFDPGGHVAQVKGHSITDGPNSKSDASSVASSDDDNRANGCKSELQDVPRDQSPISMTDLPSARHQDNIIPKNDCEHSSRRNKNPVHQVQTLLTQDESSPGLTDSDNQAHQEENVPEKDDKAPLQLEKDPVSQDRSSVQPGEENRSNGLRELSDLLDSLSESSSRHTKEGSPGSEDYTPDFESYSSTTTSEAASLHSSAELEQSKRDAKSVASEFCITPIESETEVGDGSLPEGMQDREVVLERIEEKMERTSSGHQSVEDPNREPASRGDDYLPSGLQNLSGEQDPVKDIATVQSSRAGDLTPSNLTNMDRNTEDRIDKAVTSLTNDKTTLSQSENSSKLTENGSLDVAVQPVTDLGSPDVQENLEVASRQSQDSKFETGTEVSEASSKMSANRDNPDDTGSADKNSDLKSPSRQPCNHSDGTDSQTDGGKDEKQTGGVRVSMDDVLEAGRGSGLGQERRIGEQDFSGVANMTSVWSNEDSYTEPDYPTDPEELQKVRNSVALELLWVQQAINSRKNYLRLKNTMEPTERQKGILS